MVWVSLVLLYGVLKGVREILKKKALGRNTVMEVLLMYTFLSFLIVLPTAPKAGGMEPVQYGYVAIKSFVIFLAWLCSFHALSSMPVSLYGVLDLSRVIFSTVLGIIFLHESMPVPRIIGFVLVCIGLYALRGLKNREKKEKKREATENDSSTTVEQSLSEEERPSAQRFWGRLLASPTIVVILAFLSSLLNGISGTMDKVLMKRMNESQLQFWYMLFLVLYYMIYIVLTRTKLHLLSMLLNGWIWLLSIAFVIADRALFVANSYPESEVTVMTLLKQAGCVVTIIGGKVFFQEKQIKYKLCCAAIIIAGIVVAVLPFG